jgi:hypothetical protein
MAALRRDMVRLGADIGPLNKALAAAGKAAAEPVAAAAREALPRDSGALSGTVRVSGTKSGASVRMGSKSVPYAGPVDFGGWPGEREFITNGRYLFPAAQGLVESVGALYSAATQRALDAFTWTNEGTSTAHD